MFFLVDAFTDQKFKGNPAGIFVVKDFPSDQHIQQLASFFKFPDLAFIKRTNEKDFQIRWFSPLDESPICGHATIAAAYIVFTRIAPDLKNINFIYNEGILNAEMLSDEIKVVFSISDLFECKSTPFNSKELIGLDGYGSVYENKHLYMIILNKRGDIFRIEPNFTAIKKLMKRSLIVTSPGFGDYDFCTRYFAPKIGVYEDPVCGSANCRAALIWSQKLDKTCMIAYQASEREGVMKITVDRENNTVSLRGMATTICEFQTYNSVDIPMVF